MQPRRPYKSTDLAGRYKFTDDPVDHIGCREEVNEDLFARFSSEATHTSTTGAVKPGAESLQAIVPEWDQLAAHSQRGSTSVPSSERMVMVIFIMIHLLQRHEDDFQTRAFVFFDLHQHLWVCDRCRALRGVGRWWVAGWVL